MVYLQKRVLWPNFGWASCAADLSRTIITVLVAACGLVKVFVRSITWTVPRRQSIKEAEAPLQDLRPVASPKATMRFLVDSDARDVITQSHFEIRLLKHYLVPPATPL